MELQWDKTLFPHLELKTRQVQNQEQTLELRLGEQMPDISRVICGWGQCILRAKQWNSDHVSISGGVMAWVLYAPEDGSLPRCVEAWLPFSVKWNIPGSERDGTIRADVRLCSVDARVLSARKMVIRASISALAEALEPKHAQVYQSSLEQENMHVLKQTFPVTVPAEAGEKTFLLEEDIQPAGAEMESVISLCVHPELTEQKVVGGKAVFRGDCCIHLVYFGTDQQLHSAQISIPFAQYTDLDRDYDKETGINTIMSVCNLEQEVTGGLLRLKCGLVAQYVVLENRLLELAQDAYSVDHEITVEQMPLELPVILDKRTNQHTLDHNVGGIAANIVDMTCFMEHPILQRSGMQIDAQMPCTVQLLCVENGLYSASQYRLQHQWSIPAAEDVSVMVTAQPDGMPSLPANSGDLRLSIPIVLETTTISDQTLDMITAVQIGKRIEREENRPSLLLRRAGSDSLWQIAKRYGTTMERICALNGLQQTPEPDKMLLIPLP